MDAQLRRLAGAMLSRHRPGHTMQPAELVHEWYLHLNDAHAIKQKCRGQFVGISAKVMRRILLDEARKNLAAKRNRGLLMDLEGEASTIWNREASYRRAMLPGLEAAKGLK